MPISTPDNIITPWATSGLKDDIPENADPINGRAGFDLGFPPINLTPKTAGGIPPFGQDFNGIFFDVTQALQFLQAGGSFPYDGTWATAVGGYPIGALVSRTDNQGLWRNTVANNLTDPEAGGAGWQPEGSGATSITMTSSNVTLTPLQAAAGMIIISGTLTANLQLIFPEYVKQWLVINNTSGAFSITCKTASGAGVTAAQSSSTLIHGDGTRIGASAQTGFDYLNTLRIDVASSSTINLNVAAPNTRNINITGSTSINGFTVSSGQTYIVSFSGSLTLVNSASLVTRSGANITTSPGDSCVIRSTSTNTVEVILYSTVRQAVQGLSIPTTSGTSHDITGIPSWARKIEVDIIGVSLSGSSIPQIQIGSGSIDTSGYLGSSADCLPAGTTAMLNSNGFLLGSLGNPSYTRHGSVTLRRATGNTWTISGNTGLSDTARCSMVGGSKSLPGVLDRIRLTTVNGTDTFDAGSFNIWYE